MCVYVRVRVFLPCGVPVRCVCSAEQVRLSGRSYNLAGLCVALEQVFLLLGRCVRSAGRVRLSARPYHVGGLCAVCAVQRYRLAGACAALGGALERIAGVRSTTTWQVCVQCWAVRLSGCAVWQKE